MTELRFSGDIGLFQCLGLAAVMASAAWALYYRQLRHRADRSRYGLPSLRAAAVFLLVLMLTQPVLHHRDVIGELGRLYVVVDSSKSMIVKDPDADTARKILAAHAQGRIDPKHVDDDLRRAIDSLEHNRLRLDFAVNRAMSGATLESRLQTLSDAIDVATKYRELLPAQINCVTAERGTVRRELWLNIPGDTIEDLNKAKAWDRKPDKVETLKTLASPKNVGSNYGSRMLGFIHPPTDGNYTFWICGDDQSLLYLSSSADPKDKKLVAQVPLHAAYGEWSAAEEQRSAPIPLQKGNRYFIEVLHKEGQGDDHVMVGWRLPDGKQERPIPASRLSSYPVNYDASVASFITGVDRQLTEAKSAAPGGNMTRFTEHLRSVLESSLTLESALRERFHADLCRAAEKEGSELAKALIGFDRTPRWRRIQDTLFEGTDPLLAELSRHHEVELVALNGSKMETLWRSRAGRMEDSAEIPAFLSATPNQKTTNLAAALSIEPSGQRTAMLLLTDGQSNHGESPIQQSKILSNRGVKVFTVGYGSTRPPQDLAVKGVQLPESVYYKDRAKGTLTFLDTMLPGSSFRVHVKFGPDGKDVWTKELQTTGEGVRSVDFDFPIEEQVEKLLGKEKDSAKHQSVPATMQIAISYVEGDRNRQNNRDQTDFLIALRKRRILLIDERPRWEWRYLHAMFLRDEKWDVNAVLPKWTEKQVTFKRGKKSGELPVDKDTLFTYDLVIIGDVPARLFRDKELAWLHEFVEQRTGGLVLIDGRREHLRDFAETSLKTLMPIEWIGDPVREVGPVNLTMSGSKLTAMELQTGKEKNETVWNELPELHWMATVKPLPGVEVLADAGKDDERKPFLTFRRFGSGKVLYAASPDLWRWRYKQADKRHRRFWIQMAEWLMERPFSAEDKHASIDAGPSTYEIGERADLRVRLRDHHGKLMLKAKAEAMLIRDGKLLATIPLAGDGAGLYTARTAELGPGNYAVRVRVKGLDTDKLKATAKFSVAEPTSREMSELACDHKLLQDVALMTDGAALREEQLRDIIKHLEPLSSGRVEERDSALWQSYWYFALVILLFTIEWTWRKRSGLL